MKRRMSIVVVLATVLAVTVAAPVSADAKKQINGKMELSLVAVPCAAEHVPPFLTWAGTVIIDGTTYGWADFPTGPFVVEGNFAYFEEYWTIFTLDEGEEVTAAIACDTDRVVMAGVNEGWGPMNGNVGIADGTVTEADPDGPFSEVAAGSRMMWRGKITSPGEFKATLHIFPLR